MINGQLKTNVYVGALRFPKPYGQETGAEIVHPGVGIFYGVSDKTRRPKLPQTATTLQTMWRVALDSVQASASTGQSDMLSEDEDRLPI